MMYLMRGNLPWQGLKASTKSEKYRKIKEKKAAYLGGERMGSHLAQALWVVACQA